MNIKTIAAVAVAAIATFLVTYFLTVGTNVVEAGLDAKTKDQIREVLREEMTVDIDGETKTYGQVLSSLHTDMAVLNATVAILIED